LALLLASGLLATAAASRVATDLEGDALYDHSERWCLSSEAEVACQEGTAIEVFSAFTSRAWSRCGLPTGSGEHGCEPNITQWARSLCQGRRSCTISPSAHPTCNDPPQHSMRVAWSCVASSAEELAEEKAVEEMEKASAVVKPVDGEPAEVKPAEVIANKAAEEEEEEELEKCSGLSVAAETFVRKGHKTTVCRNVETGRFAKKACCEQEIPALERAMEACQEVQKAHCKPDAEMFAKKRHHYPDVPEGYLCHRKYKCMKGKQLVGIADSVAICGSHRLEAHRACVPKELEG